MKKYPDSFVEPLRNFDYLVANISRITNNDPENVRIRLVQEQNRIPYTVSEDLFHQGVTPYVYSQEMSHFYESTDSFLYEIVTWNRMKMKCKLREWILQSLHEKGLTSGKILFCGDGIGLDSLYFAKKGYDVTSFEVSKYGNAFAKQMFQDFGVTVTMSDSLESLPEGSFDAILCLDVLEHLPDPPQAVREGAKLLKPGGFYISSSPYYVVERQWPTHLKSNKKYSGAITLFEKAGDMKLVDGRFLHNPLVFQRTGGTPCPRMSCAKFWKIMYGAGWLRIFRFCPWMFIPFAKKAFRKDEYLREFVKEK